MGSRAIPGGPKQHTSVVEEAWRGQEASKSVQGARFGHCRKRKVYGEAGRGPEASTAACGSRARPGGSNEIVPESRKPGGGMGIPRLPYLPHPFVSAGSFGTSWMAGTSFCCPLPVAHTGGGGGGIKFIEWLLGEEENTGGGGGGSSWNLVIHESHNGGIG